MTGLALHAWHCGEDCQEQTGQAWGASCNRCRFSGVHGPGYQGIIVWFIVHLRGEEGAAEHTVPKQ